MEPNFETLENVGQDLDESRVRIRATRESLQAILERNIDVSELRQAVARLERLEADLDRVEAGIAVRQGLA